MKWYQRHEDVQSVSVHMFQGESHLSEDEAKYVERLLDGKTDLAVLYNGKNQETFLEPNATDEDINRNGKLSSTTLNKVSGNEYVAFNGLWAEKCVGNAAYSVARALPDTKILVDPETTFTVVEGEVQNLTQEDYGKIGGRLDYLSWTPTTRISL
jgi:hypothetical protein